MYGVASVAAAANTKLRRDGILPPFGYVAVQDCMLAERPDQNMIYQKLYRDKRKALPVRCATRRMPFLRRLSVRVTGGSSVASIKVTVRLPVVCRGRNRNATPIGLRMGRESGVAFRSGIT